MEVKTIVSNTFGSNTHLLINNSDVIIFDAGAELESVKEQLNNKCVKAIFLTHLHFDHVYNLASYVNQFNCPVYLFDEQFANNSNYTLDVMCGKFNLPNGCYKSLKDKQFVNINGITVMCYHTPGHSYDSMCFQVKNHLFSGDTLFYGTIGRTDLLTSNTKEMLNSLEFLKTINFETCYSGHGQNSNYLDQEDNIKYFIMEL